MTLTTPAGRPRRRWLIPAAALTATLMAGIGVGVWLWQDRRQEAALLLSGRIEGYETDLGARISGTVLEVTVREGQKVRAGQLLVRIDGEEVRASLRAAAARVTAARQRESQARSQIRVLESQIQESQLNLEQARADTEGRVLQARARLAAAEAQLSQAQAQLRLAKVTAERTEVLLREGATSRQTLDQDRTAYESAQATVTALGRQVDAARGALALAEATNFNPSIRQAELAALRRQQEQARAQLRASQAEVSEAIAARQEVQARVDDLTIDAPIDAVVIARSVEPGAVVGSGHTLLTLLDPATVYLRGFVPEGAIGRVRVGQQARVFLDSDPDRPLEARVAEIDAEASFTPENIYFKQDRVRQVFGVKIALTQPAGYAKPGMPADAEILTP